GLRRFGHEIGRGLGGQVPGLAHAPSVRLVTDRKPLLVAPVDAVLYRPPARGVGLPSENHLAAGPRRRLQGHPHRPGPPPPGATLRLAPRGPAPSPPPRPGPRQ